MVKGDFSLLEMKKCIFKLQFGRIFYMAEGSLYSISNSWTNGQVSLSVSVIMLKAEYTAKNDCLK